MMLSLSMQTKGEDVDLSGLIQGSEAVDDKVPNGKVLARFAEAVILADDAELAEARDAVIAAVGGGGLVDAACVVGHFERMVRVADATGIPLDASTAQATSEIRETLGINSYRMAARTLGVEEGL